MEYSNLSNEELVEVYIRIMKRIKYFEDDYSATKEALKDSCIDYMERRELENDLVADQMQIDRLNEEIKKVIAFATSNNVNLAASLEENTQKKR